jgi:hypothetical protein
MVSIIKQFSWSLSLLQKKEEFVLVKFFEPSLLGMPDIIQVWHFLVPHSWVSSCLFETLFFVPDSA